MNKDFEAFKKQAKDAAGKAAEEYRPYIDSIEERARQAYKDQKDRDREEQLKMDNTQNRQEEPDER